MFDMLDEMLESAKIDINLGEITKRGKYGLTRYDINIDRNLAKKLQKAVGKYTTINCSTIFGSLRSVQEYVGRQLGEALQEYVGEDIANQKVLVVGLGNGGMVADSLGVATGQKLLVTGGIIEKMQDLGKLYYIEPKVKGITGVASFDIIMGVINAINPDIIIAIDTLCTRDVNRLCCSFQISDAGIMPGGGVGNTTKILSYKTLNRKVIAIGVPLIIRGRVLSDIVDIAMRDFTVKEIDYYILACANVIADGINRVVHGKNYKKYMLN